MHLLAADIGGTHCRLGLFDPAGGPRAPLELSELSTRAASDPASLLTGYLRDRPVFGACIAIAGAVIDDSARGSNLPWPVRTAELATAIGAPVRLINDLEATAVGILELGAGETAPILEGRRAAEGPIGVIAPGTGLGQAMLVHRAGTYQPIASEAGHIDFAPGDETQVAYWRFLRQRFGHVSLERACSGSSFGYLVEFLAASGLAQPAAETLDALREDNDPTPTILDAGLSGRCEASALAIDTFVKMLGAAAGNLALQVVATGGIYLAGGLPPRLLSRLRSPEFSRAFAAKGRFTDLMQRIPVSVVTETHCGLFGAARRGLALLGEGA